MPVRFALVWSSSVMVLVFGWKTSRMYHNLHCLSVISVSCSPKTNTGQFRTSDRGTRHLNPLCPQGRLFAVNSRGHACASSVCNWNQWESGSSKDDRASMKKLKCCLATNSLPSRDETCPTVLKLLSFFRRREPQRRLWDVL